MRVVISGITGFVGKALTHTLKAQNSETAIKITGLSRDASRALNLNIESAIEWPDIYGLSETGRQNWLRELQTATGGEDFVFVHLSGANVGQRWSGAHKKRIYDSRFDNTGFLADTLAASRCRKFIGISAIGVYDETGDDVKLVADEAIAGKESELASRESVLERGGLDFLAGVTKAWEYQLDRARRAVGGGSILRLGVVFGDEGALPKIALPFRMRVGGPSGHGRQWVSWIHIDDVAKAIVDAATGAISDGVYNLVAPNACRNADLAKTIAKVLGTHSAMQVPALVFRMALRDGAEIVTGSQRVAPEDLVKAGYEFIYPELEPALRDLL